MMTTIKENCSDTINLEAATDLLYRILSFKLENQFCYLVRISTLNFIEL